MPNAKFVISILALDGLEMTKKCIASILSGGGNFDLILTDNGSTDGTADYFKALAEAHPFITVVSPGSNTGFISPNNAAFEIARERKADFFTTCNNDLEVPAGWLDKVAGCFMAHPTAAVVGPKGTICELSKAMIGFSRGKLEFIEGSLMTVKISLIQGTLFDTELVFIYHEDSQLSLRMQRAGYSIHQADFHVEHRNGSTCTRHPDAIARCRAANVHNQQLMIKKWAHWNMVRRFDFQIVVKRSFAVGDVLLTTPIIRALKKLWPLCPIDVETGAPDLFKGNPYVRRAASKIGIQPQALVIDLNGAYEKTPGIPVLASYARVAAAAGLEYDMVEPYLDLYFQPIDAPTLPAGPWVALHVGPTTWPGRTWPLDRWATVAERLTAAGWKVLLFGEKGPEKIPHALDKRGQKGFQELAGLLIQCALFIGLDSFPSHAAAAVCTPAVVLFGVTDPGVFAVNQGAFVAVRADPAHPDTGKRNKIPGITFMQTTDACMRTISVDQVIAAVKKIIPDSNL